LKGDASRLEALQDGGVADVRARIGALYAAHARRIAEALGEMPLCTATGPRRFGKTTSLLPALASILQEQGRSVRILNGRNYEHEPFAVETLPPEPFDVLIIDEANVLTRTRRKTERVLRLLHTRASAVVAMITFDAGYEAGAVYLARIWQECELSVSGQKANIVCLPQMVLNKRDAGELLALYSPIRDENNRSRVLSYILDRVPLNPHVLLELSSARAIAEANEIILQRKMTLFQRAVSPDEYRVLELSLEQQMKRS
jgi:hypothetical protein